MNTDLELFKQALSEGLNLRIQSGITSCTEKLICSKEHRAAMAAILGGTYKKPLFWSSTRTKIAAILVAAMMLLAGCTVLYKDEIRDFIEHIYEEYIEVTFSDGGNEKIKIEEVYELTYIPDGYVLENTHISNLAIQYTYINSNKDEFYFQQNRLEAYFGFDSESGYSKFTTVNNINVYHKQTPYYNNYLWNDGKYAMLITSTNELSSEELQKIIEGIKAR